MIVDSSAVVGILNGEPSAEALSDALVSARNRRMSAATLVELYVVVDGTRDQVRSGRLAELLRSSAVDHVRHGRGAHIARAACRDFGRGSGHLARLNFGDCFSYPLAKVTGEPLLFNGDDFGHTDITLAVQG